MQVTFALGIVQDNSDAVGDGRLKVYIPSIDAESFKTEDLPWARYVSPYGGTTANMMVGPEDEEIPGITTYGFWAVPKVGAQVLCGFIEGDSLSRFWIGCLFIPEHNHSLPGGVEGIKTEIDDTGQYGSMTKIPFQDKNLTEAGLNESDKHFRTRGGWQRSVSYPAKRQKRKPTDNGYAPKPTDPANSDSQIVSLTTPGRHFMALSDVNTESRIRFKTALGTQIIMDDTNERIYISTARGRNYFELDEGSGKVYWYSASKINIHGENDVNIYSDENVNIVAKKRVNIKSEERGVKIQAKLGVEAVSEQANIRITASRDIVMKTTNGARGVAVSEKQTVNQPPYAGKPLGVVRDWAEEAGSSTSGVKIDAYGDIENRSNTGAIRLTAKGAVDLRSITSQVSIQAGGDINLKASNLCTTVGDTGLIGVHGPVASAGNAGGASSATNGSEVKAEDVKKKMIVPKHESWERDEDEKIAKTPRNSKYQG